MNTICMRCMLRRQYSRSPSQIRQSIDLIVAPRARQSQKRWTSNPADRDGFLGLADTPPILVKTGKRHGPGLIILGKHILSAAPQAQNANNHLPALIPITAFALGTWQIFRLEWKSKMIATFEDRLIRAPLPLPPHIDPSAIKEFDYRRVYATGRFRHDQEMLIGPRMHDGNNGYLVITPLEREGEGSTVLVNRGWIAKTLEQQAKRREGLPRGVVTVQGLLREPWKKNLFTPENKPEKKEFYFPDVQQMAALTGSQAVWIEETMQPDLIEAYDREAQGRPIGRPAEVNLRNNHTQYIFTWYGLCAATSIMLWMIIRKPPSDIARRVRQNKQW